MSQSFAFLFPDDFDLTSAADIRVNHGYVLTLPFRIRTGRFFVLHVGDSFDLIFRNHLDIPLGTSSDDVLALMCEGKSLRPREQFCTQILILDKKPPVPSNFREAFIGFLNSPEEGNMPGVEARYFKALSCLNDALVGYHHATNSLFGGAPLARLGHQVFFERLRYLHTIVCPMEHQLSENELLEILDARAEREFIQMPGQFTTSQLDDVPDTQLEEIQRYTALHQRFLFYQFVLDAKSRMVADDYVSAILFAVIALEGVHSTLLQMRLNRNLADSISDTDARAKRAESMANRLLKDVGFSETLEMTSLLLLDAADRPPEDEMQNCKLGITIRNEIMHALAKKGQYRLRNRTNKQISEAYSSVLKVVNHFATLVERDTEGETG